MSASPNSKHHLLEDSIPENKEVETPSKLPSHHHLMDNNHHEFLALPHKRTRTLSENERLVSSPTFKGTIQSFCRNKGHGFILPDDGSEPIFVHISDIEGSWCPKEGDIVTYKKELIPPRMQKFQAVHVHFVHLKEGVKHEHWDNSVPN